MNTETQKTEDGSSLDCGDWFGWYVAYVAEKSPNKARDHRLLTVHPALWAASASKKYTDGPYIILCALPLTKAQYDEAKTIMDALPNVQSEPTAATAPESP
jgi:hypothetical protein